MHAIMDTRGEKMYFVVNVGDVHDVLDVVSKVLFHDPPQDVKCDVRSGMAHVGLVVHRWATAVPGDFVALIWNKQIHLASEGVVQLERRDARRLGCVPGGLADGRHGRPLLREMSVLAEVRISGHSQCPQGPVRLLSLKMSQFGSLF